MSDYRFLTAQDIPSFLAFLAARGNRVLVPTIQEAVKESVVFTPWHEGMPCTLKKATVPPKFCVLPPCETLLTYKKVKDPENPENVTLTITDTPEAEKTAVFACRTCDARGIAILDRPYLKGPYRDPYYAAKRDALLVISLTCNSGCETCFCHYVGAGPSSPEGSDILMTELPDGFVLQGITEKGKDLLAQTSLADGEARVAEMTEQRKAAWQTLSKAPDWKKATESVAAQFSDSEFWSVATERCISCGACTYFCPTCYCFTISDEGDPTQPAGGRRLRSWDTCMSSLFTREASGHNPRSGKAERMRNRVSHKFATYPENWGSFSCSGCGRCIAQCPVGLDIREIVSAAVNKRREG